MSTINPKPDPITHRAHRPQAAKAITIDPDYRNRRGYRPDFLGRSSRRVELPALSPALLANAARLIDAPDRYMLDYHHFSIVVNRERRLAFYTAVNIDGPGLLRLRRDPDRWRYDPRLDSACQLGVDFYAGNDLDSGHLVRRLDPVWGSAPAEAKAAQDDTYHFTNCSPQHRSFNRSRSIWAGLEDYILNHAKTDNLRVSVFSGPVFDDADPVYRGVRLPRQYWKVVAAVSWDKKLLATAYLLDQSNLIDDLSRREFTFGAYRTFQVPVRQIETLTGLRFDQLARADPLAGADPLAIQKTAPREHIRAYRDIRL